MHTRGSLVAIALLLSIVAAANGCAKKDTTTGGAAQVSQAPMPFRNEVTFQFSDVSVTTAGPNLLRLGFSLRNNAKDSVFCDSSVFTVKLTDGSVIAADTSAEDKCTPDTLDPGQTAQATMFFNLPAGYTGPIELSMSGTNAIIGRGTTTIK